MYRKATAKANLTDIRFHDLRYTFASHAVMAGIDLNIVKEILGHSSVNITMRYSPLSKDHKKQAVNTLENVLKDYFFGNTEVLSTDSALSQ